jgi:hypothetical protein
LWVPQLKLRFRRSLVHSATQVWGTNWGTHKNFIFPEFQNMQQRC